MTSITKGDLMITLKAAVKMAQQDERIEEHEKELLKQIMELGRIDPVEVADFKAPVTENIEDLSQELSSEKAKKLFLLTLATVALADNELAESEVEFLTRLTKKLKVGRVKIEALTYQSCQYMVFKLIDEIKEKEEVDFSSQPSDMDLF